jgi:hypothetical protein
VRVLLAEEAAGRDAANPRTGRERAGFPAGKTFGDWDETASSILEDLGGLVRSHRADDSLARAIARPIRSDLIIIDDIGLLPVSPDAAEGFCRRVDAAYERRSLAVSSNLHPSTGSCTTPTSWSPKATASASPKPPPARE